MPLRNISVMLLIFSVFMAVLYVKEDVSAQASKDVIWEKLEKARELIRVQKEQGKDVSGPIKKLEEARMAGRRRDLTTANRLLDEALKELEKASNIERKEPAQVGKEEKAVKTVSLDIDIKEGYLVKIDPKYKKGKEISKLEDALEVASLNSKGGKLELNLNGQPIFIVRNRPRLSFPRVIPSEDSPFGFHPAKVEGIENPYQYALDIGVSWHRPMRYVFWATVQKDIRRKEYDWTYYDNEIKQVPGLNLLYNIIVGPPLTDRQDEASIHAKRAIPDLGKYIKKNSYMPMDEKAYMDFVTACVERYDGDGVDDMPGLKKPIKFWQIGNEPHPKMPDFVDFVKITSKAIKRADPSAQVVIGGALNRVMQDRAMFDKSFLKILEGLGGKYIDIIDFHWGGDAQGNYRGYRDIYIHLREELSKIGFPQHMPVWITEMSTYSGDPIKLSFQPWDPPFQSEEMQARDVIKRYVYGISQGIDKIFWAWGMIEGFKNNDSYFDHTGFIYDGKGSNDEGRGVKKLAYYSYKLMTAMLEGSDWKNVKTIVNGKDNLYVYKFNKKGSNDFVYVVWWDYFNE